MVALSGQLCNTAVADCGSGPQHISGDVISRISEVAQRPVGENIEVHVQPRQTAKKDGIDGTDEEDGMSVVSCMDLDGFQDVGTSGMQGHGPLHVPVVRRRRVTRTDRLGSVQVERLRPRRRR